MTTITYRDGVMASDTLIVADTDAMGYCDKVFKINGYLVGLAGSKRFVTSFLSWAQKSFETDRPLPEMPFWAEHSKDHQDGLWGYVVTPDRAIFRYETQGLPYLVESEYVACGSGREYAMGAMACGKSPKEAVEVAMLFDRGSGGEIRSISLND